MTDKKKCYQCKYRRMVPGDAHSRCAHPSVGETDPLEGVLSILASVGRVSPIMKENELNIKYNEYGYKQGWFNWPYNFDPTWLENCDGFEEK